MTGFFENYFPFGLKIGLKVGSREVRSGMIAGHGGLIYNKV